MSFLSDAVSQAERNIKVNVTGQVNSVKTGLKDTVSNARNAITNTATGVVTNTVKTGLSAVGSLLAGNVSGALGTLANAPSNILGSALSGLSAYGIGGSGGTTLLQAPGTSGAMSSNNGITPGDDLLGARARTDPLMSFCWYAQLPVINPAGSSTTSGVGGSSIGGLVTSIATNAVSRLASSMGGSVSSGAAAQLPWYFVEEASMPWRTLSERTIFREGRHRKYPERYDVDNLKLGIYADSSNSAFKYLQAWNNAIITPFSAASSATDAGGWGRPSDFKKPIYIYLLDVTKQVMAIIEYTECWPTSMGEYTMTSGQSERIINQVNFSVGDVFINLVDVSADLVSSVIADSTSNLLTSAINGVNSSLINSLGNTINRASDEAVSFAVQSPSISVSNLL